MRASKHLHRLAQSSADLVIDLPPEDPVVSGMAYDSREVAPGDLFVCVPGLTHDGHGFAGDAVRAGAAALCVERPLELDVPQLRVSDARRALARLAAAFYEEPSSGMLIAGVTGTNGKTTTTYLLDAIFTAAGLRTGLIGTVETRVGSSVRAGVRTTPESLDLQRLFAEMRDAGVEAVSMEVTSHALALHRVEGVSFAAAGFTNLSQDHLDFHRDMEDYFEAKSHLFTPEKTARGAVNADDPYGRKLLSAVTIPCVAFGVSEDAEVRAGAVELAPTSSTFELITPAGSASITTPLVGAFHVSNCLAAAAVALQAGAETSHVATGLASVEGVPGRFESVDQGQPFTVVVDYAHTPDSLENVLGEAGRLASGNRGRVICTFGCGGDRDRGKRPLMGAVVARLAGIGIVTSDNPRSEDPRAIVDQIVEGFVGQGETPAAVLVDRAEAIYEALARAAAGDVVVIAGKGHETGQQFADVTVPFDDRVVAREALAKLGWGDAA